LYRKPYLGLLSEGTLGVIGFGLIFTPAFYTAARRLRGKTRSQDALIGLDQPAGGKKRPAVGADLRALIVFAFAAR